MTVRRLMIGSFALVIFGLWCWSRPAAEQASAQSLDPALAAVEGDDCDGNHEEQEQRFRTSQCRHWKHVMLGTR